MNRHKISPNAIVVALFGLAISGYVGIANKSILGFLILILLTIVGAVLVNRIKTGIRNNRRVKSSAGR